MPKSSLFSALVAGLLSAAILLAVVVAQLGFFFLFLSTLPLFFEGLSKTPRMALIGAVVAAIVIGLLTESALSGALFMLFLGLPAWYLCRMSLQHRNGHWFPVGDMMLRLMLSAVLALALITAFCATQEQNIVGILADFIHDMFSGLEGAYSDLVENFAKRWSFLLVATMFWVWAMALYAHAWLANKLLTNKHRNLRPDFAVRVFSLPDWMLSLLAICAVASLIGGESMRFLGRASLIVLLLPYFFLGVALMHESSKTWPNRRFFLFLLYVTIFLQFWPALVLAGMGLWHHIKCLSAHPTSTKS